MIPTIAQMGLRAYRELIAGEEGAVDLENALVN